MVAKKVKFGNMGRTNISRVSGNFAAWAYERLSIICWVNLYEESSLERSFKVSIFQKVVDESIGSALKEKESPHAEW